MKTQSFLLRRLTCGLSVVVKYQDGQTIPIAQPGASVAKATVALRSLDLTASGKEDSPL
jgi:hypothetical protein